MKHPRDEAIRRMVERLNDKERADLSTKLDNIVRKSQEHTDVQLVEKILENARHNLILSDLDIRFTAVLYSMPLRVKRLL